MNVIKKAGPGREKLARALKGLEGKVGKVGWFESAKYEDGTPVAYVATIQEYGYPGGGIPPRSFMRSTVEAKRAEWKALAKQLALQILEGKITAHEAMEVLGLKGAGDIKETITLLQEPRLKDSTVAARLRKRADGKTIGNLQKPLVDSGVMLNTLNNIVEDE